MLDTDSEERSPLATAGSDNGLDRTNAPLRVGFHTFGCRSNYADTVDLQAGVLERGAAACALEEKADVYVINTCTVTDSADKEALKTIARLKRTTPTARIVITGCLAEVGHERLCEVAGDAIVIGPGRRNDVLAAIFGDASKTFVAEAARTATLAQLPRRARRADNRVSRSIDLPLSRAISGPQLRSGARHARSRFHLRIQEGCVNHCTFCIIPRARGGLSSRSVSSVLKDLSQLVDAGYNEVVLCGTHLGGYGHECERSLFDLLEAIELAAPPLRVRLSSLDPNDITPALIDLISRSNVFCPYLHICIQAFSDRMLKRMNRRYHLAEALDLVRYAAATVSGCGIGCDVITGFPGESREEVDQAMALFLELPFSYLHVFPYSERSGTAATRLDGSVPMRERRRRAARWRAIAERKEQAFLAELVGRQIDVILEHGGDGDDLRPGTSAEFASVRVKKELIENYGPGDRVFVQATGLDETNRCIRCE